MTCPLADVTILYPAAQTHAEFAPVVAAVKQLLAAKSKKLVEVNQEATYASL